MNIQAKDGPAVITGNFQDALAFVRACAVRRYEGKTKVWHIGLDRDEIQRRLPRYLTIVYDGIAPLDTSVPEGLTEWLRDELTRAMPEVGSVTIDRWIEIIQGDFTERTRKVAKVTFSSTERAMWIHNIIVRYDINLAKLRK